MSRLLRHLRTLVDLLFGFDFFISYAHGDGYNYPEVLTKILEQEGFKVFLDSREYVPGDDLKIATRRRIRMSRKLVVIARPFALESQWVLKEVKISLESGRVPIVIDINSTIEGAEETSEVKKLLKDKLHIRETLKFLDDHPSQETLTQLSRSFSATRQETRRLRFVTAVAFLLALMAVGASWQYMVAEEARKQAEQQRDLAQGRELAAQSLAEGAGDPELGVLLALESIRVVPTVQAENALRSLLPDLYVQRTFTGHDLLVLAANFNVLGDRIVTAGGDRTARIYEIDSGRVMMKLVGHESIVNDARFSPDGNFVVTSSQDATARVWDAKTGDIKAILHHKEWVISANFSEDGTRVITTELVSSDKVRTYFWDPVSGKKLHPVDGFDGYVSDNGHRLISIEDKNLVLRDTKEAEVLAQINLFSGNWVPGGISTDGKRLVVSTSANKLAVWDLSLKEIIHQLDGHDAAVTQVAFSPDNRWIATASDDFTARLWSLTKNKEVRILRGHTDRITSIAFSPDGRWVATGSADNSARLWDALSGRLVAQMRGHKDKLTSITFHPTEPLLLTAGDITARLWRVTNFQTMRRFKYRNNPYHHAELSPNNALLVATGISHADIWGARTGVRISQISSRSPISVNVDFHPKGQFFALAGFDGRIRIGDAARDHIAWEWSGHTKALLVARFDPTGEFVVSAGEDKLVRIWKRGKPNPLLTYAGHNHTVKDAVFSHDGETVATGDFGGYVHLWSAKTGELLAEPVKFPNKISRLRFHSNGAMLLVAMVDEQVILWTPSSKVRRPLMHPNGVSGAAFTPDGKYLMTGDNQNHLYLWDINEGKKISALRVSDGPIAFSDLSTDGQWLVTIEADNAVRLYPWELLAPGADLVKIAKQRLARSLTTKEHEKFMTDSKTGVSLE